MKKKIFMLLVLICGCIAYAQAQHTFSIMGKKAYISGTPKDVRIFCPPPYNKACFRMKTNVFENEDPIGTSVEVSILDDEERTVAEYRGRLDEMDNSNSDNGNYITLFCEECE